eukprot:snap_masked-scaffold633_size121756-processed-gene-0.3 protein:Tk02263 transcript:snap_masked-scaffold633_size121756-processed-gene-0.3-mRNA-1 annotation:"hypothetical protein KGM_15451"
MAPQNNFRDISGLLQMFRQFLAGRVIHNPHRFEPLLASRDGPEANLPPGSAHKVAGNYYFTRDGRREVKLPGLVADNSSVKALVSGSDELEAVAKKQGPKRPGKVFNYGS